MLLPCCHAAAVLCCLIGVLAWPGLARSCNCPACHVAAATALHVLWTVVPPSAFLALRARWGAWS